MSNNEEALATLRAQAAIELQVGQPPMTSWRNPLRTARTLTFYVPRVKTVRNRIGVADGYAAGDPEKREYQHPVPVEIAPGQTVDIPSMYDRSIKAVQCLDPECQSRGNAICKKGHPGTILGGLCKDLVRVGKENAIHPALTPAAEQAEIAERARAKRPRKVEG